MLYHEDQRIEVLEQDVAEVKIQKWGMLVSNEKKKYSIKETTKVEREKIVQDAYAIAVSTGKPPTEETMQLVKEYVDGKKEISGILEETIRKYRKG